MAIKLEIKNLYKIFGEHPQRAFKYIEQGLSKEQILEKTGLSLGVKDASLAIEEGEIFVIMGLSGSGKSTMVRLLNRLIEPTRGQVLIDGGYSWLYFRCFMEIVSKLHICENILFIFYLYLFFHFLS